MSSLYNFQFNVTKQGQLPSKFSYHDSSQTWCLKEKPFSISGGTFLLFIVFLPVFFGVIASNNGSQRKKNDETGLSSGLIS